ncbi:cytochrome P450 [Suillus lakei]|nr:cytochrome P450 [Suillus lakei]
MSRWCRCVSGNAGVQQDESCTLFPIGNVQDMPRIRPWLTFAEWGKKYGDISHVKVLGQHIMVLNSAKTAMEMLDKKGTVYSDRPVLPMGGELCSWKHSLPLLPYGDRFRRYCKNFHRVLGSRAALEVYYPMEEIETRRFLKRVLTKPDQLQEHLQHTAGAIVLRISFSYEVKENNDPFVDLANRALDQFSRSTALGAFMVPEWFPGAGFKRLAREWRETLDEMVSAPNKFVRDRIAAGIAPKSFTSDLLRVLKSEDSDTSDRDA